MVIKTVSRAHFDALTYSKLPFAALCVEEQEWYSDEPETILGIVTLDLTDNDWGWLILGRDEKGLFRAVHLDVSIASREEARARLHEKMREVAASGETVFPQGDNNKKKNLILQPVVPTDKLNPNFKILIEQDGYSPAREIIREMAYAFIDVDGNYINDFQTTGFNARLWELYLFAVLHEQKFAINRDFDRPDFCATQFGFPLMIEACTVNPTDGEISPSPETPQQIAQLRQDFLPIKFGSALYSKLKKRYWELPHIKGLPFALAIHDFHSNDSMTWSASALDEYLYGVRASSNKDDNGTLHITEISIKEHIWGSKRIPSGFFNQPDSENISAVIFSNAGTIAKFNRMGKLAGFGNPKVKMVRTGLRHNFDPNADKPIPFSVEVEPGKYTETWSDGVRVFHNPNALNPFPPGLLPGCSRHFFADGKRRALLPDGFVHTSMTVIFQPKSDPV